MPGKVPPELVNDRCFLSGSNTQVLKLTTAVWREGASGGPRGQRRQVEAVREKKQMTHLCWPVQGQNLVQPNQHKSPCKGVPVRESRGAPGPGPHGRWALQTTAVVGTNPLELPPLLLYP